MTRTTPTQKTPQSSGFCTTNWSALASLDSTDFADALAELCQQYWYPVYAFIRRRTRDTHRAEDLTQAFFCKVISLQTFRMADRERGRFRAFLLTSVKNFLLSDHQYNQAQKRGGEQRILSLDFHLADQMYQRNQSANPTAEQEFDRAWALSLIEHAIDRLKQTYSDQGDDLRFELFVPVLRSSMLNYSEIASRLGVSESTARKAVSRFRAQYGQSLRDEIVATLSDTENLENEIDWILNTLKRD